MTQQQSALPCNRDRLVRSLEDALPERDEEQLVEHLSNCAGCRIALERLAAGASEWTRVGTVLRSEPSVHENPLPPSESGGEGVATYEDTLADFAVDFLAPAFNADALGRLDGIDILSVIGRGGMGVVLKGFEEELNRAVVVKMLAPHLASSGAARKRFAREAQAAAVIVHPNVMPILTVNSAGRLPYLVMPYMACESLQQRIDHEGPLATLDVLRISHQVACGLAAAHSQGLVHRDVKPANILLERGVDRVMLTDFGLARAADDASLTRTGVIAGTPQFMSPEQARGEAVDARSDLFCLGSVMYVLCAGRPPFRAETSYGVLRRVTDEEPRSLRELNPGLPDWLVSIVSRLHSKCPADRFQSAEAAAEVLEQCLAHVQQPAVVPLPTDLIPSRNTARRTPAWSTITRLASVACVAAVCITIGFLINPGQPDSNPGPRSTPDAELQTDDGASLPVSAESPAEPDSTGSESRSPGEAWHGAVGSGILELRSATDDIEASSRKLWDIRPIGTAVNLREDGQNGPSEGTADTSSSSQETFE